MKPSTKHSYAACCSVTASLASRVGRSLLGGLILRLGRELLLGLHLLHQVVVNFLGDLLQVTLVTCKTHCINLRGFKKDTSDLRSNFTVDLLDPWVNAVTDLLFLSVNLVGGELLHWCSLLAKRWESTGSLHHWLHLWLLATHLTWCTTLVLTTTGFVVEVAASSTGIAATTVLVLALVGSLTTTSALWWVWPDHLENLAQ